MAKPKRKKRADPVPVIEPTPEQFANGTFHRVNMAYRRFPMIDKLVETGKINDRQHHGLSRYRDIVAAEEGSPIRDSLDKVLQGPAGGSGNGHIYNTSYELARLESALGTLRGIAYAIAFEDKSPSQWAMETSGAVEIRRGNAVKFEPRRKPLAIAMLEIRFAGDRLAAAIGA